MSCLSTYLSFLFYLSAYVSISFPANLPVNVSVDLSSFLSIDLSLGQFNPYMGLPIDLCINIDIN